MRVVVATDLSEASLAAVDTMTACAAAAFERVVLVHAVDLDLYTAGGTVPAVVELAVERLGEIADDLRSAGFADVGVRVEVGPAVETIETIAAEEDAGLVVMTSLGRGAVAGRLLGSTAERLAARGRVPVLIERVTEREGAWCRLGEGGPFARVLVGTDLSGSLADQLSFVSRLPGVGEVRVVHVADPGMDPEYVREQLAQRAAEVSAPPPHALEVRADASAADGLLAEAVEWDASVIAVSPAGRGVIHRALWGSTARRVAQESPVPVLFVPVGGEPRG